MLHRVPDIADRAVARKNAVAVATLIGARVASRRQIVLGEPNCPYELRWNTEPFWFGVQISDSAYVVRGNHKRRFESALALYVSLKTPNQAMGTRLPLEPLSRELGVSVFVAEARQGPFAAAALRSGECRAILSRVRFNSIRSLFLSPVQIHGISDLVTPEECSEQVTVLRELLLGLWRWSTLKS
jgi:hypothetical protein